MPCWYFDKDDLRHSPSEADGINFETETRYREEGAGYIIELANKLGIHYDTYATAVVYFHRFYMLQSFRNFHRHVLATSCLLLSSKLGDSALTLQDLLKMIKVLLSEKQFSVFGSDPQQEVIQTEMSLLETLKFDLDAVHPYAYVLHYTKLLEGNKETIQQLLHMSWTFVNDSLYTTLCVQYEPDLLGLAFLYLACRLTKFDVISWHGKPAEYQGKWYEHFVSDMNIEILKDICHQVLGLYSRGQNEKKMVVRGDLPVSHSPDSVRRQNPASPTDVRHKRQSSSPVSRRDNDRNSRERTRRHDKDHSPVRISSSSSSSRSQSRHRRRSFSRSPSRRRSRRNSRSRRHSRSPRRRRSARRSYSPRKSRSPASKTASSSDPKSQFLSPEGFEEIQAKLRAGNLPPGSLGIILPPPPRIGSEPPLPSFGPPVFQPFAFPPVAAFPYPLQSPVPPVPGAPILPPRPAFPPMHQEVRSHPAVIVHSHPPPVIGVHHAQIPRPGPEVIQVVHPPGMIPGPHGPYVPFRPNLSGPPPPDIRGPFLPDPRGPYPPAQFPPDIRGQFPPPYVGDPRVPYSPNIPPPDSGAPVHPEVCGTVFRDFRHPPNSEGQNTAGNPDMTRHQTPFVPGDGSRSDLHSGGTSPDVQSSPIDSLSQSPGDPLRKRMFQKNVMFQKNISQARTNLIYPTYPDD